MVTKQVSLSQYTAIEFGRGINHSNQSFTVLFVVSWNRSVTPVFNYSQQSGPAGVEVTIDDNLFPYLDIEVSDGLLHIQTKKGTESLLPNLLWTGILKNWNLSGQVPEQILILFLL